jgi:predicted kinase
MPRLIFFCGHAGTGKTTLAKRVAAAAPAQQRVVLPAGQGHAVRRLQQRRDGGADGRRQRPRQPLYLQHLRGPEYAGLLNTARENLALGVNCIVVGPLSREVRAHQLADRAWLGVADDVVVRVVWVHLQEDEARRRIQARGNPNDAWKLAHWDDYRTRLFMPEAAQYPELLLYDNTQAPDEAFEALLQRLDSR